MALALQGRRSEAEALVRQVIDADPKNVLVLSGAAMTLALLGKAEEVEAIAKDVLARGDETKAELHMAAGNCPG